MTRAPTRCAKCGEIFSPATPRLIDIQYGSMVTPELRQFYCPGCAEAIFRARAVLLASMNWIAIGAAQILGRAALHRLRKDVYSYDSARYSITYIVTPASCSCLAGRHDVLCRHRMAAAILSTEEDG